MRSDGPLKRVNDVLCYKRNNSVGVTRCTRHAKAIFNVHILEPMRPDGEDKGKQFKGFRTRRVAFEL